MTNTNDIKVDLENSVFKIDDSDDEIKVSLFWLCFSNCFRKNIVS